MHILDGIMSLLSFFYMNITESAKQKIYEYAKEYAVDPIAIEIQSFGNCGCSKTYTIDFKEVQDGEKQQCIIERILIFFDSEKIKEWESMSIDYIVDHASEGFSIYIPKKHGGCCGGSCKK